MIIKELYIAEFGGIKNQKIEFGDNKLLNIIYGENESGKSTIFLFIKFMLYGLQRKSQSNVERERSLSWSGSVASGSMVIEYSGKDFRIERTVSDRARGEKLVILSLDSGAPISTDKSVGEYFLGVPREVFESSACVGQMRSSEINGEKTAQSLSNILSSADESVDSTAVLKELNSIRVSYLHKNQGGGMLFEDEAKINSLRMKLDEAKNASLAIEVKSENFDKIKKEYDAVKLELEERDAIVSQFNKIGVLKRFEALRKKENELSTVIGKKDICAKSALITEYFPDRTHVAELRATSRELSEREALFESKERKLNEHKPNYDAALAELGASAEQSGGRDAIIAPLRAAMNKASSKSKLGIVLAFLAIAFSALSVLGFFLVGIVALIVLLAVALGIFAASIAVLLMASKNKKCAVSAFEAASDMYNATPDTLGEGIDAAMRELACMRAYNAENSKLIAEFELAQESLEASMQRAYKLLILTLGESIEPSCETLDTEALRLNAFLDEYDRLAREEDAFLRMLENEKNALSRYNEEKIRSEITVKIEDATPEAVDEAERSKSFLLAKKNAYENKIAFLQNELIALRVKAEDPIPIADRLASLEEKNKKDREFYDALLLAMNVIEESSSAMSGNVTPIISKTASEFMARMSADKYNMLRTNSRLNVMLDKDGFAISSDFLSAGTKDTAYIALRIALIMQIYKNERTPIIFDESFCQLDDKRMACAMELLYSLANEGIQIIVFTSHKREKMACREKNIEFNEIIL